MLIGKGFLAATCRRASIRLPTSLSRSGKIRCGNTVKRRSDGAMRLGGNYSWHSVLIEGYPLLGFLTLLSYLLWTLLL